MKKTIQVSGMSCSHCEARVQKMVGQLPGIESVVASAKAGTVVVEYDDKKVMIDQIHAAILKAGYEVNA